MDEDDLSQEQADEVQRLVDEVERESARVQVDWNLAAERLRALAEVHETATDDQGASEMSLGLDVTLLARTLRRLPDGAGTAAFLAAFEADEADDAEQ